MRSVHLANLTVTERWDSDADACQLHFSMKMAGGVTEVSAWTHPLDEGSGECSVEIRLIGSPDTPPRSDVRKGKTLELWLKDSER